MMVKPDAVAIMIQPTSQSRAGSVETPDLGGSWVRLLERRHRGWPLDQDGFGLSDLYGVDGWCRACGTPLRDQIGGLKLRRSGLTISGAWIPNWQFDVILAAPDLARRIAARFPVSLRPVEWARSDDEAFQLEIPTVGSQWYDPRELVDAAVALHGSSGRRCETCEEWRWYPVPNPPPARFFSPPAEAVLAGSPERFGDGWSSVRHRLVRRDLAEMIVEASPRDFEIVLPPRT